MTGRHGKDAAYSAGSRDVNATLAPDQVQRQDAFRVYVEPEIEVLLRVARTLTGSWADAEDVVQDTLIRAYKAIDSFDGRHPRAWLLTILRRAHLNSLRRQRPDLLNEVSDAETQRPAFGAAASRSPEDAVVDTVFDDLLQCAVDSLDERFRTVLLLIDVDQLSYTEVSEALGIPVGTVMSRLSRARDRVRTQLRANSPRWGSRP